jgi:hypothetical protein
MFFILDSRIDQLDVEERKNYPCDVDEAMAALPKIAII